MDSDMIQGLLILGKTAVIICGGCAFTLGSIWGICAGAINFYQRKDRRDELLPLYEQGTITTRPTILNVHRIPNPQM
jgi:hypothetical protein